MCAEEKHNVFFYFCVGGFDGGKGYVIKTKNAHKNWPKVGTFPVRRRDLGTGRAAGDASTARATLVTAPTPVRRSFCCLSGHLQKNNNVRTPFHLVHAPTFRTVSVERVTYLDGLHIQWTKVVFDRKGKKKKNVPLNGPRATAKTQLRPG